MDLKLINKIEIFEFIYRVDQGKILNKSSDFGKFAVFYQKCETEIQWLRHFCKSDRENNQLIIFTVSFTICYTLQ